MLRLKILVVLAALWNSTTIKAQQSPLFEKPLEDIHLEELRMATWKPISDWLNLYEKIEIPLAHLMAQPIYLSENTPYNPPRITCEQILQQEQNLYITSQKIYQLYQARIKFRGGDLYEDLYANHGDMFSVFVKTMHHSIQYFCSLTSADEKTHAYYHELGESMNGLQETMDFLSTEILQPDE